MQKRNQLGRRGFLRCAAAGAALLGLPALGPALARADNEPWTIAVLPDTQFYVRYDGPSNRPGIFMSQTKWICDHLVDENIVFVSHVGDVVNNGKQKAVEWQRANAAIDQIHGRVPYSVVPGNHDLNRPGSRSSGMSAFVQQYGKARYTGMPWYGGCSGNQVNHYQVFGAGMWTFLHIGLELEAPDAALEWASSIIQAHSDMPTIVSTHSYLNDTTGRPTRDEFQGNSGEQIWRKFVRLNPQIFMVLNGHFYADQGERQQVSTNNQNLAVFEMCSDYQTYPNGGNGWMRLIRFEPANNQITVRTYSPWLDKFIVDSNSQFSFSVDLTQRFANAATSTTTAVATASQSATPAPSPASTIIPTAPARPSERRICLPLVESQ